MIVAHANHLVSLGHNVSIASTIIDTVFTLDSRVLLNQLPSTTKLGTILGTVINRLDADLIIADIIPMACFLFLRYRRKVVYFAQDYDEAYYTSPFLKELIRLFYFVGLNIFHIPTVAVSYSLAILLRNQFNSAVYVAENGIDTKVFYPDPDPELVASKGDSKAVLLLSRNDQRKGFDIARAVIGRLQKNNTTMFEVWTVGEKCFGVFEKVVHRDFGYVEEARLRKIMSSANLFLYPTRHEGFGLMPLEALACCCPVVTTEAVVFASHLENSLVAEIENVKQISDLTELSLTDAAIVEHITVQGVCTAKKLSLDRTVEQFVSALTIIYGRGQR
ncbi:MAG: glycosyltransferase family 4 protein [Desulfuromonadales bacterium]